MSSLLHRRRLLALALGGLVDACDRRPPVMPRPSDLTTALHHWLPHQRWDCRKRGNPQLQVGMDLKTGTVFYARFGRHDLTLDQIADKEFIPASLQKSLTAAVILDMTEMEWPGKPGHKLLRLDEHVPLAPVATHLICGNGASGGNVREVLKHGLDHSNNGSIESLAALAGQRLLAAGMMHEGDVSESPSHASRIFVRWAETYARKAYDLSPQFSMLNAHGLPGGDTLYDPRARNPVKRDRRVGKRIVHEEIPVPDAVVQKELALGWRADPKAQNVWGLLDGAKIMRHWVNALPEHLPLLRKPNEDESFVHRYAGSTRGLKIFGKHGFTRFANAGFHCVAMDGDRCFYALAHGQPHAEHNSYWRFERVAEVLALACAQPARRLAATPARQAVPQPA